MLQRLHRTCIFDIDETAAVTNAQRALDTSSGEEADPAFWDRLVQEELGLDQRITAYQRFALGQLVHEDEILLLLREMLARTPTHHPPSESQEKLEESILEKKEGKHWTPTQRLQVRLLHVLERWARATNDPRLRWINPVAPVRNYAALLQAVAECWENAYLPEPKLFTVLQTVFESFITWEDAPGYLLSLDPSEHEAVLARIPNEALSLASALVYVALGPNSKWKNHVFRWQAFLVPGIELGVFQTAQGSDAAIEKLANIQVSTTTVEDWLLELAVYMDDLHWCAKVQKELDLDSVAFQAENFSPPFKLALAVQGISDPLQDPRLIALVRRTFQYKRVPGLVIIGPDWRVSIAIGEPARVRRQTRPTLTSPERITTLYLAFLEQQGLGLRNIFADRQEVVS